MEKYASEVLNHLLGPQNRKDSIDKFRREQVEWMSKFTSDKEKLKNAEKILNEASDEDIAACIVKWIMSITDKDGKIKQTGKILNEISDWEDKNWSQYQNSDFYQNGYEIFADDDVQKDVIAKIRKSSPSDFISIDQETDWYLQDLGGASKHKHIPSDLFFAKTIPLTDCVISVDETKSGGKVVQYRVVIFDDYKKKIDEALENESDEPILVGAMFQEGSSIAMTLAVLRGLDWIASVGMVKPRGTPDWKIPRKEVANIFSEFYRTWYGIQLSLLHPEIKDIYKKPTYTKYKEPKKQHPTVSFMRQAKYIKRHIITANCIEEMLVDDNDNGKRDYHRKCLVWYVIGHWRTLKNGTKTFIQPYWKGKLREIKQNLQNDERIRVINEYNSDLAKDCIS